MINRGLAVGLGLALLAGLAAADDKDDPIVAFAKAKLKNADKPFTLMVMVKVKEGAGAKFETAFAKAAKETLKEKGCLRYELNRDSDDAAKYLVYERWKSLADLKTHLATDHIKALRADLPDLVTGAPELRIMLPTDE